MVEVRQTANWQARSRHGMEGASAGEDKEAGKEGAGCGQWGRRWCGSTLKQ